jgi:methionyl-tRNA synthetase
VTKVSQEDQKQIDSLNVSYDRFIRTTDDDHKKFSAEFFEKSLEAGDIYKDKYEGYYCEGCEAHKTLSELDKSGQCPLHPNRQIQLIEEENYFFEWSKYEDFLRKIIESDQLKIRPEGKRQEMLAFLDGGLRDITVTRPKYKVSWGITAPNDDEQVIYVWFDALINYLTEGKAKGFWDEETKIIHFVGKDIARWHSLLWPAMLKSAGYRLPDEVYIHGFINLEGEKISKSLGNVIRPTDLVEKYGTDAVRYYLLKNGPITEDADISITQLEEIYNGELANGLGNTVARIAKLAERSELDFPLSHEQIDWQGEIFLPLEKQRTDIALANIWNLLSDLDKHINEKAPWAIEDKSKLEEILKYDVSQIRLIAKYLQPFLPETSEKIWTQYGNLKIRSSQPLFPRIN